MNVSKLVQSSILIAVATVLYLIKAINLPYGGSVTLCSMLPIFFIGYKYTIRWGIFSGIVFGVIQMIFGSIEGAFKGVNLYTLMFTIILDYIIAFAVLGFVSMFKNKFKSHNFSFLLGVFICCFFRYIVHVVSGFLFFRSYASYFFSQQGFEFGDHILKNFSGEGLYLMYAIIYNVMYMLPETILTVVCAMILFNINAIRNKIVN